MAIVMGRLKNRWNTILPIIWERDASRSIFKGSTIVMWTIQHFVNRYSALIELKKYASWWTRTRRKISPIVCRKTRTLDTKNWWISLNTSGRKEPMKLRSDFNEASSKLHRLHRESGEERLAPIPSWQYQKWHPSSSSSSTSWWQWNDFWWSSSKFIKSQAHLSSWQSSKKNEETRCAVSSQSCSEVTLCKIFFVVVRSFTADSSLLQPTVCVNITPHTSHFSLIYTHTRGSCRKFGVRTSHSMCHLHGLMLCVWFSSTSPLSSLCCLCSLPLSCLSSWPSTSSSTMWWTKKKNPLQFSWWGPWHLRRVRPVSHIIRLHRKINREFINLARKYYHESFLGLNWSQ